MPSDVGIYFSDTRDLASESRRICWRCSWLRKQAGMYGMAATVSTPTELYPIAKDIHKAWLFTTPPPAPFFVTLSSSTMQHLAWRTPVTLDNRFIKVRFGPQVFTVRPDTINRALSIADASNQPGTPWRSPLYLDRKAQDERHGLLTRHGRETLDDEQIAFLTNELTRGEQWALAYVMHSKRPVPHMPEPVTAAVMAKMNK